MAPTTGEHLLVEERAHQLLVGAVAQGLGLLVNAGGMAGWVGGALFGEAPGEDLLGGPVVDGVGGDLDLEHAVGQVLADAALGQARAAGSPFEGLELAAPFVDGDDAALGVKVGLDLVVFVLAGDLADPAARAVARRARRAR